MELEALPPRELRLKYWARIKTIDVGFMVKP
jgi:hypothetical protein